MKKAGIFLLLFFIPLAAMAGPPYLTDDPDPVAAGAWELYGFYQFTNYTPEAVGSLPGLEVNYGLLGWMQLHLIVPAAFYADDSGYKHMGPGDTETGIKIRFIDQSGAIPMIGTFPHIEIPTGDSARGLGTGDVRVFLPLWLQMTWVNFMTYGGGGYWIETGRDRLNSAYLGWVLRLKIIPGVIAGLEINYSTAQVKGGSPMNGADVGLDIALSENSRLLLSYGTSITGDETYFGYIGYRMTFGQGQEEF